jgi:glutaredoxin
MKFTVYSKPGCPYCEKIIQVMDHIKADYVVYVLGSQFTREEFYSEFGEGSTFPQVVLDEKNLGGCSDTIKYLQEQNII